MRTSQVNQTPYCLASHMILAKNLGWSEDQLTHLAEWPEREGGTPAEKAALRLAETVTRDANAVSDEQFAELSGYYSEGEIVELLCVIGLFDYFNRFNNGSGWSRRNRRGRLRGEASNRPSKISISLRT